MLLILKKIYRLLAADLSKQKALDKNSRAIQQIIFTGKASADVMVYYIFEQSKGTILQFWKGTTKVPRKIYRNDWIQENKCKINKHTVGKAKNCCKKIKQGKI